MARSLENLQQQYQSMPGGPSRGMGRGMRGGRGMPGGKPRTMGKSIARILAYLIPYWKSYIVVFFCLIITTITSLLGSYFLKPIIDRVASVPHSDDFASRIIDSLAGLLNPLLPVSDTVCYLLTGILCLGTVYVLSSLTTYIQSRIMIKISQTTIHKIRGELHDKVQRLPLRFHDSHAVGETMSRFTNDVDNLGLMLDSTVVSIVSGIITLAGTLFFMIKLNPILTLITVLFIPLFTFGGMAIAKKSGKYYSEGQAALGSVNGYIEETVSGQKVVKVFNHEGVATEEFETLNQNLRAKQIGAQFFGGIMGPIMGNLSKISYAITAGVGGILCYLTLSGAISPTSALALTVGGLTVFVNYANQFSRPINEISMQMNTVLSALAGAERVFQVLDELPESDEGTVVFEKSGDVVLSGVSFGYVPGVPVLKNLSLVAHPGEKIAFVGSTGAGKTTITNLINRFYDTVEGAITINGVNVNDFTKKSLRENIAMVLQDTHLFSGTVMENIRYGRPDATDEEVIAAAKTASAHSFIMRLEKGYDTLLTGDGANLSQGQRQLLNIARAAISKAPILILDEATSSVDTRTERHIEHGMDRLMKNRTTFVIAHRLSTVKNSDEILVLEHGEIIEKGRHEELLDKKGRYYDLYTGKAELD